MLLAEKNIDCENIQIDLKSGEQMGDAFRAINPRCTVPALVTEDGIRDSVASRGLGDVYKRQRVCYLLRRILTVRTFRLI